MCDKTFTLYVDDKFKKFTCSELKRDLFLILQDFRTMNKSEKVEKSRGIDIPFQNYKDYLLDQLAICKDKSVNHYIQKNHNRDYQDGWQSISDCNPTKND